MVPQPRLWSPETPVLYTAASKLYAGETLKDEYTTRFGIRSFAFEANKGFSLNGQPRKFKGVCNHHDLGPLGAAVNVAALRRQLTLLKEMGGDALRTSHNMPAPELVQLCDELGVMLMVESFDEWKTPKVKNGYSQYFDEWVGKGLGEHGAPRPQQPQRHHVEHRQRGARPGCARRQQDSASACRTLCTAKTPPAP